MNDNYCDDVVGGLDEGNTSACSFFNSKPSFVCTIDGHNTFLLPSSRVQDGICDCCDGRDEIGSPFYVSCKDTCDDNLVALRKEALIQFRNVQAGLRSKGEVLSKWQQQKVRMIKSYDSLVQERQAIIEYLKIMRYFLHNKEVSREQETHWMLIRERENHCAMGSLDACDYFHPTYLTDDELMKRNVVPPTGQGKDKKDRAKRKRFVYEYNAQELESFRKSTGLQRVRATICPNKDLLPDDDGRIFVKLDEYYDYMTTYGTKKSKNSANVGSDFNAIPVHKVRKYRTLFGKYLEHGEEGYLIAMITGSEFIGLALSPIILLHQALSYLVEMSGLYLWDYTASLAHKLDTMLPDNPKETPSEEVGLMQHSWTTMLQTLRFLCNVVLDAEVDNSPTSMVLSYLDYTQYSFLVTRVEAFYERFRSLFWVADIAYRAPTLYYEFYILQRYRNLPPRRHACVLREALQQAQTELHHVEKQISDAKEVQSLQTRAVVESLTFKRQAAENVNQRTVRKDKSASSPKPIPVTIDFGIDNSWEALAQECVWAMFDGYNYTFCLFDEITQDGSTSLGIFEHWGRTQATLRDLPLLRQYLLSLQYQKELHQSLEASSSSASVLFDSSGNLALPGLRDIGDMYRSLSYEVPGIVAQFVVQYVNLTSLNVDASGTESSAVSGVQQYLGRWLNEHLPAEHFLERPLSAQERQALLDEQLRLYYGHQYYDLGTPCPQQRNLRRSTRVQLVCGSEYRLTSVVETSVSVL